MKCKIEAIFSELLEWTAEREEVIHYNESMISALEIHANLRGILKSQFQ